MVMLNVLVQRSSEMPLSLSDSNRRPELYESAAQAPLRWGESGVLGL